ncbi:hypothetical protein AABM34_04680 [Lysinibacillus fusiformis]
MKFALSFFSILVLIISGTLFFQYHAYSSDLETGIGDFHYSQEIEIVYRENSLDIRQHFKNLPNQKVKIKWYLKRQQTLVALLRMKKAVIDYQMRSLILQKGKQNHNLCHT